MKQVGNFNPAFTAEAFGLKHLKGVSYNLDAPLLYEAAISGGEAEIAHGGPLVAETGVHTGRSPRDKFIVRDEVTDKTIWWDNSNAMSCEHFDVLYNDFLEHAKGKHLFAQDLYGGADPAHRVKVRVFTELAWHSLFIRTMLIRPPVEDLRSFTADMTIIDLPSFRADPKRHGCRSETVIAVDFTRNIVLIGASSYAGEMKKSVFGYLNFVLPAEKVMPMHCSANVGKGGDRLYSLASLAPARQRFPPIRTAPFSAMTSTAGAARASSISRAAAMPKRSGCRAKPNPKFTRRPSASARSWRMSSSIR